MVRRGRAFEASLMLLLLLLLLLLRPGGGAAGREGQPANTAGLRAEIERPGQVRDEIEESTTKGKPNLARIF